MITGSILTRFSTIELGTADGKRYAMRNTPLTKLAFALIGVPHLGFRARARIIFRFLKGTPLSARILDAGSGYGIYALSLAARGYAIDTIDLEKERSDALSARKAEVPELDGRIRVFTGSLTALPFPDAAYDAVICSEVVEHIAEHEKALEELARILAPGGTLIFTVPYASKHNARIYRMFGHERPGYTVDGLRSLIAPLGLHIEEVACYEYLFGSALFSLFNRIRSAPFMAALFYPFYLPYLLDMYVKIGEPNGICFKLRKR